MVIKGMTGPPNHKFKVSGAVSRSMRLGRDNINVDGQSYGILVETSGS